MCRARDVLPKPHAQIGVSPSLGEIPMVQIGISPSLAMHMTDHAVSGQGGGASTQSSTWLTVWGLGFGDEGLGFRVEGSGFRFQVLDLRV